MAASALAIRGGPSAGSSLCARMYLTKDTIDEASFIGATDIDLFSLKELTTVALEEEIARMICSVSSRPDRNGL
jgi:hypothetical protein